LPAIAATIENQSKPLKSLSISGVSHSPRGTPSRKSITLHSPVYRFPLSRPASVNAWPIIWFASRLETGLPASSDQTLESLGYFLIGTMLAAFACRGWVRKY
jgi:hypothetical protein